MKRQAEKKRLVRSKTNAQLVKDEILQRKSSYCNESRPLERYPFTASIDDYQGTNDFRSLISERSNRQKYVLEQCTTKLRSLSERKDSIDSYSTDLEVDVYQNLTERKIKQIIKEEPHFIHESQDRDFSYTEMKQDIDERRKNFIVSLDAESSTSSTIKPEKKIKSRRRPSIAIDRAKIARYEEEFGNFLLKELEKYFEEVSCTADTNRVVSSIETLSFSNNQSPKESCTNDTSSIMKSRLNCGVRELQLILLLPSFLKIVSGGSTEKIFSSPTGTFSNHYSSSKAISDDIEDKQETAAQALEKALYEELESITKERISWFSNIEEAFDGNILPPEYELDTFSDFGMNRSYEDLSTDCDLFNELSEAYETIRELTDESEDTINVLMHENEKLRFLVEGYKSKSNECKQELQHLKKFISINSCGNCEYNYKAHNEINTLHLEVLQGRKRITELEAELETSKSDFAVKQIKADIMQKTLIEEYRSLDKRCTELESAQEGFKYVISDLISKLDVSKKETRILGIALEESENILLKERLEEEPAPSETLH